MNHTLDLINAKIDEVQSLIDNAKRIEKQLEKYTGNFTNYKG